MAAFVGQDPEAGADEALGEGVEGPGGEAGEGGGEDRNVT